MVVFIFCPNVLNLPEKIVAGSEEVSYIYSASGQKLATKAGNSTTYYRGSFIYNDDELDHLLQPEGVIRKTTSAYVYYYAKKDHLGSTRVLCHEANGKMIADQTTDYYPFGLSHHNNGTNVNRYLFSGKELQDQTLNGKSLQLYDFGARNYDPVLGRWFNIDPALQFTNPYIYCANNPVMYVDPDGRKVVIKGVDGAKVEEYEWQEKESGWGFYNSKGDPYGGTDSFFGDASNALTQMMSSETGRNLIMSLVGMEAKVNISMGDGNAYYPGSSEVTWNPNGSKKESPTQNGKNTNVPYISLSHELAHAQDDKQGTMNNGKWLDKATYGLGYDVPFNEIYSTHVENRIRQENGLSLRTYYLNNQSGTGAGPRIIDFKGRSIFYNVNNKTNYKMVSIKNRFIY